jgi:hypothetical protein
MTRTVAEDRRDVEFPRARLPQAPLNYKSSV